MIDFRLIGHSCPLGKYPSVVLPVGNCEGRLVVLYQGAQDDGIEEVGEDRSFVHYQRPFTEALVNFDPSSQRLFAYSEQNIVPYGKCDEPEFFNSFLSDPEYAKIDPFLRFSFAKRTHNADQLLQEIGSCLEVLSKESPRFSASWVKKEAVLALKDVRGNQTSTGNNLARGWQVYTNKALAGQTASGFAPANPLLELPRAAMTRLLVIDDDRSLCESLKQHFGTHGYEVETANNAAAGLMQAFQWLPHIIILDFKIPGVDGYDFLRSLKKDPEFARIPVIMLSGNMELIQSRGNKLPEGITKILVKPVMIDNLLNEVKIALNRQPIDWPTDPTPQRIQIYEEAATLTGR